MRNGQKAALAAVVAAVAIGLALFAANPNVMTYPILHLVYSEEYMLETATDSDVVRAFLEEYPDSAVRYAEPLDQQPVIVFEMIQNDRMAFLAVGNFEGESLVHVYRCFSPDYSHKFFDVVPTLTARDIVENPCFS